MASGPQEFTKSDGSLASTDSAGKPTGASSILSRLKHGRAKWMGLLSISVVLLSLVGLFQRPHPDAYRVVHAAGFDSRGQFTTAGFRDWLLHPIERNAFLRLPAITSQVRDICVAPNSNSIWIVGDKGMILHSADDGATWVAQSLPPVQSPKDLEPDLGQDIPPPEQNQIPNQRQDNAQQQQQQRPIEGKSFDEPIKNQAPPTKSIPKKLTSITPRETPALTASILGGSLLERHGSNATYISAPPPEESPTAAPMKSPQSVIPNSVPNSPPPAVMMRMENPPMISRPSELVLAEPMENLPNIIDVSFYDAQSGWLLAEVMSNDYSIALFHTSNAGKVWQQVAPDLTPKDLSEILDNRTGVTELTALSGGKVLLGFSASAWVTIDAETQTLQREAGPATFPRMGDSCGVLQSGRWYRVDSSGESVQLVKGQIGQANEVAVSLGGMQNERIQEIKLGADELGLAITTLGNMIRIQADGSHQYVKLPQLVTSAQSSDDNVYKLIDGNTAIVQVADQSGPQHIITKDGGATWHTLSIQSDSPLDDSVVGSVTKRGTVYCIQVMGEPCFIAHDNALRPLSRENGFVMTHPAQSESLLAISPTVIMSSSNQGYEWRVISRRNQSIKVMPEKKPTIPWSTQLFFEESPWHFQWDPPLSNSTWPQLNADSIPPLPEQAREGSFLTVAGEYLYLVSDSTMSERFSLLTCRPGDQQWMIVETDPQFKESYVVAMGVSHQTSPPSLRILFANLLQYDVAGSSASRVQPTNGAPSKEQVQLLQQVLSDIQLDQPSTRFAHLAFVSPARIVLSYVGNAQLESADNGMTWQRPVAANQFGIHFDRSIFLSPMLAVAPVWDGTFRYSSDSGQSWSQTDSRILAYRKLPALWYWLSISAVCVLLVPRVVRRPAPVAAGRPMIETVAISDAPLQPGQPDYLGLVKLSRGISLFLRNSNTKTPLTVAIEAPWGAGKSSLMNLLAKELRDNGCRTAWFNAWHHQGEESLLAALLETIRTGVNPPVWTMQGLVFRYRLWWRRFQHAMKVRPLPILGLLAVFCASAGVMWWSMQNPPSPKPTTQAVATTTTQGSQSPPSAESPPALVAKGINEEVIMQTAVSGVAGFFKEMGLIGVASKISLLVSFIFLALPTLRAMTAIGISPSKLLASAAGSMKPADLEAQTSFRVRFARQFQEVTEALEPESKLIIFIDDIDRCSEDVVAQTLQACNYLVTSGRCIIVLGMDAAYVRACVRRTYGDLLKDVAEEKQRDGISQTTDFASNYLEKLVNIRITLPRVTTDTVKGLTSGKVERTPSHIQFLRRVPVLAGIALVLFFVGLTAVGMGYGGWLFAPTLFGRTATTPTAVVMQRQSAVTQDGTSTQPQAQNPIPDRNSNVLSGRMIPQLAAPGQQTPQILWIPLAIAGGLGICLVIILTRRRVVLPVDSAAWTQAINAMSTALVHNRHATPREIKRIMNRLRFDAMRLRAENPQSEWWTSIVTLYKKLKAWSTPAAKRKPAEDVASASAHEDLYDQAIAVFGMLRDAYPQWLSSKDFWEHPASFALLQSAQGTLTPEAVSYLNAHREMLDITIRALRPKFEEISQVGASNSLDAAAEPKVTSRAPGQTQAELTQPAEQSA